jgi:hypothetical protein
MVQSGWRWNSRDSDLESFIGNTADVVACLGQFHFKGAARSNRLRLPVPRFK